MRTKTWSFDETLWQFAGTANSETVMPGGTYVISGAHGASVAMAQASVNSVGNVKNNETRLYRNGSRIQTDAWNSGTDSSAGTERFTAFLVPAFPRSATYQWRFVSSATGTWASARRSLLPAAWPGVSLDPRVTTREVVVGGLPSVGFPKWTNPLTSATGQRIFLTYSGRVLTLRPQGAGHAFGIRQPVPASGPFSVIGQLQENGGGSDTRSGIFVSVAGGKAHVCGPFLQENAHGVIGVTTASYTADWSGYDGFLTSIAGTIGVMNFFRIRWDGGNTLSFDRSTDNGATWTSITTRAGMTRPDACGICIYSNGGAGPGSGESFAAGAFRLTSP